MKIEIGVGKRHHSGYETIDVEAYANPTYLGDFRTMHFENLDEIRSHHLFEHFNRKESLEVLKLWNSWLKLGGTLIIETPDFEGICKSFSETTDESKRYWLCRHSSGSQEADWSYHRDGWWEQKFRDTLPKYGFQINSISKSCSRKYLPNITVLATKNA